MAKRAKSKVSKSQVEFSIEAGRPRRSPGYAQTFQYADFLSSAFDKTAEDGRDYGGRFSSRATKNAYRTVARGIRKESMSKSQNNYNYDATKEEATAQRNARYRDIRTALGLSAG